MKEKKKVRLIRGVCQLLFFVIAPGLYSAAFGGVRSIAEQLHSGQLLKLNTFISLAIVLCLYTIIFGRFFCGYACAFGSFGDFIHEVSSKIQKKIRKKVWKMPVSLRRKLQYIKYILLIGILVTCFLGIYSKIGLYDPWEIFGSFTKLKFAINGRYIALVLLGLIVIGMLLEERFFCQFLCPMGAVFALLPVMPFSVISKLPEECATGCNACQNICPASLDLSENSGECIHCMECVSICPKKNAGISWRRFKGNEILFTLIKAAVLFAVCYMWI